MSYLPGGTKRTRLFSVWVQTMANKARSRMCEFPCCDRQLSGLTRADLAGDHPVEILCMHRAGPCTGIVEFKKCPCPGGTFVQSVGHILTIMSLAGHNRASNSNCDMVYPKTEWNLPASRRVSYQ
jgi:hypothetical protein